LKNAALTLCALLLALIAAASAASADGQAVSSVYWLSGENGKLTQRSCTIQAASALTTAGFKHVDTGTNDSPIIFADHGAYQAAVFCLGNNGTVTMVVMGPDQATATSLRKKFSSAWKSQ
jgi:hypothetical protein